MTSDRNDYYRLYLEWEREQRHHSGIIILTTRRSSPQVCEALVRLQELYPDGIADLILYI